MTTDQRMYGPTQRGVAAALLLACCPLACGPTAAPAAAPEVVVTPVASSASAAPTATAPPSRAVPTSGPGTLLPLMWMAFARETPVPQMALTFRKTTMSDVLKLTKAELPKPYKLEKRTKTGSFDYVMVEFDPSFLIFKFGNEDDEYRGKLISVAFTAYYPHRNVPEHSTSVYKAIVADRGKPTYVEKFKFSADHADDKLDIHIWNAPDMVVTYRAFHDDDEDQDVVVVVFTEGEFFRTKGYWDY